eukprot:scaffold6781_cov204-Amphora_coffeaeformis.AAC.33
MAPTTATTTTKAKKTPKAKGTNNATPTPTRRVLSSLEPTTATVADLYAIAVQTWPTFTVVSLAAGVPPRPLMSSSSSSSTTTTTKKTTTLEQAGLQHQDRIVVTLSSSASASSTSVSPKEDEANQKITKQTTATKGGTAAKSSPNKKTPAAKLKTKRKRDKEDDDSHEEETDGATKDATTTNDNHTATNISPTTTTTTTTTTPSRPKRQAAKRAEDSFAPTMAAQDALLRAEQPTKKKSKPSPTATRRQKPPPRPKFPTHTTGRRLQDGATVVAPRRRKPKQQQSLSSSISKSEEQKDPSVAFLETLHSRSRGGTLLRAGYKQAVANAYEKNRAVARCASIPRGIVALHVEEEEEDISTTISTTRRQLLHVEFRKGVQGRGTYTEEVDYLPRDVVQQVITSIHPVHAEALRPENLALLSPRVFWSIVYHARDDNDDHHGTQQEQQQQQQQQQTDQPEIQSSSSSNVVATAGLTHALTTLCPDLDWNFLRRRKQTLSAKARENLRQHQEAQQQQQDQDWEAAAAAIASVEQAMEQLDSLTTNHNRPESAEEHESTWKVVTPDETDRDELQTCLDEGPVWETSSDMTREDLVDRLLRDCHIHNWRELANADAEDLMGKLGLSSPTTRDKNTSHVQAWLVRAQWESLDELMVEICQGRTDAVQALAEHARSATPKDLAAWKWIVEELRNELLASYRQNPDACPTVAELTEWCHRAEICLEQLEWTGAFVTPLAG